VVIGGLLAAVFIRGGVKEGLGLESWYFAYGSNLSIEQMIARTGAIGHVDHHPRIARLANHRLAFQQLDEAEPAFANIVSPGDGVVGVLYRCSRTELESLDHYEQGYELRPVTVVDQQGETLAAVAYIIGPLPAVADGRPSAAYLKRIVTGARQHGLPEEYIASVVAIAAVGVA
jgi:gamma-glutamylcyclotransferase (GGCT)/AIG2-like uncharacterized protein YtfP